MRRWRRTPRWQVVEAHTVLEVPDGVLDLGVAAVVGLEIKGISVPVGDEGVIAVVGEQQSYARIGAVQMPLTDSS